MGPEGRHCCCEGKSGQHKGFALRDAPFTVPPKPATFNRADDGGADQLVESILSHVEGLRQGPLLNFGVSPVSQLAGGESRI